MIRTAGHNQKIAAALRRRKAGRQDKLCTVCEVVKPLSYFGVRSGENRHLPRSHCRSCERATRRVYHHANRERAAVQFRKGLLKRNYGITPAEYDRLVAAQRGVCAICGQPPTMKRKRLDVDHDHRSGAVRALLCSPCNIGLGAFRDDLQRLQSAISYLRLHGVRA